MVPARHCYHKSLTPLMEEVRQQMGSGPVYISFDIDALDPSFAPGTGISNSTSINLLYQLLAFVVFCAFRLFLQTKTNKTEAIWPLS